MILLRPDCLAFKDAAGGSIPCSVHELTVQIEGQTAGWIDQEMICQAAQAVVHYFKTERGQTCVSPAEFAQALERALKELGLNVEATVAVTCPTPDPDSGEATATATATAPARVVETDLRELAVDHNACWELLFFPALRQAVCSRLEGAPVVLRFDGLRDCVKQLAGTRKWTAGCQRLCDEVVDYLRGCLSAADHGRGCLLVVR